MQSKRLTALILLCLTACVSALPTPPAGDVSSVHKDGHSGPQSQHRRDSGHPVPHVPGTHGGQETNRPHKRSDVHESVHAGVGPHVHSGGQKPSETNKRSDEKKDGKPHAKEAREDSQKAHVGDKGTDGKKLHQRSADDAEHSGYGAPHGTHDLHPSHSGPEARSTGKPGKHGRPHTKQTRGDSQKAHDRGKGTDGKKLHQRSADDAEHSDHGAPHGTHGSHPSHNGPKARSTGKPGKHGKPHTKKVREDSQKAHNGDKFADGQKLHQRSDDSNRDSHAKGTPSDPSHGSPEARSTSEPDKHEKPHTKKAREDSQKAHHRGESTDGEERHQRSADNNGHGGEHKHSAEHHD